MKRSAHLAGLIAAAFMFLASCGGSDGDGTAGGAGSVVPELGDTQGMSVLFPTNGTMNYLSGYDSVGGTIHTTPCLQGLSDILKDTSANPFANVYEYQMKMVESKTQVYDFLQASYQNEVKYVIGKNQTAVDMSNEFKHESRSIYVAVKSTWDGPIFSVSDPKFDPALDFHTLHPTYTDFVKACGDSYVLSIQSGVHFYALFKFTFSSTSDRNTVHAKLYNKTFSVSTTKELNNTVGFDTSTSSIEVTARIVGGTTDALDISKVKTVDQFFDFVAKYADSEKAAIQAGKADGLKTPDPHLLYGYAVNAVIAPYKPLIQKQFKLPDSYFSESTGATWFNLKPLAGLYADQVDAYNQLDFMIQNPNLFQSATNPGKTLTDAEIVQLAGYRSRFQASASAEDETSGLQALMVLCSSPDQPQTISPSDADYSDVETGFNGTARQYCRSLYGADSAGAAGCDTLSVCQSIYSKLQSTAERDRLPFFSFERITTKDNGVSVQSAIVDTRNKTLLALPSMVTSAPADCAAVQAAAPETLSDGSYTVYFQGHVDKPFTVDCVGMGTPAAQTYLPIATGYVNAAIINNTQHPVYNYMMVSMLDDASQPITKYRTFRKYLLMSNSTGVAIDARDLTFSQLYNPRGLERWWQDDLVFGSVSAQDQPVDVNVDLTGTGLALRGDNVFFVMGEGRHQYRPSLKFHSYTAANRTYLTGMTAYLQAYAFARISNQDAAPYIWLEYVPDVANNNAGAGSNSAKKTVPVQFRDSSATAWWCSSDGSWSPPCANPVFLITLQDLYSSP